MEICSNPVSKRVSALRAGHKEILIGVELETQKFEGYTWADIHRERVPMYYLLPLFEKRFHEIPVTAFNRRNSDLLGRRLYALVPKLAESKMWFFGRLLQAFTWTSGDLDRERVRWSPSTTDTGDEITKLQIMAAPLLKGGVLRVPVRYEILKEKGLGHLCLPEAVFLSTLDHALNNGMFSVAAVFDLLRTVCEGDEPAAFYRECYQKFLETTPLPRLVRKVADDAAELCGIPVGVGQDMTVDGPEFQFPEEDGAPPNAVKTALDRFLKTYTIAVDGDCSFHIHISSEGMRVGGGAIYTQFLMLKFLSDNAERFPRCVMERVVKGMGIDAAAEYYDFQLQEREKHLFVADRVHTWEFRCFGNVKTMKDANTCIDLAIDAFLWAHHPDVREEFDDYKHGVGKLFNLCHLLRVNLLERFKKILKGGKT
jgi:hypothetical protein